MIIAHGAMHSSSMFLWGETSDKKHVVRKRKSPKGDHNDRAAPARYPHGTDEQGLAAVPEEAIPDREPTRKLLKNLVVWLPTIAGKTVPSSPLVSDKSLGSEKAQLSSWTVTTYCTKWKETIPFLCACSQKKVLVPGIVIGDDLAFWLQALRFAGSLVACQQYLPSIEAVEEDFHAVWVPLYLGDEAERLMHLAQSMPPVARAIACVFKR